MAERLVILEIDTDAILRFLKEAPIFKELSPESNLKS